MTDQEASLKSPKHKLVAFFMSGRDKWKERAQEYRKSMRTLQITVRDLQASRDGWKEKYVRERRLRLEVQRQSGHPPPRTDRKRRTAAPMKGQIR